MVTILSYIGTFIAGGLFTLFLHCCLILSKESDMDIEDKKWNKKIESNNRLFYFGKWAYYE